MVYDGRRAQCVLFGGQGQKGRALPLLADTWIYAKRQWRQVAGQTGPQPTARCGHCLAFDEQEGVVVLFGGVGGNDQSLGDTWVFDGSSWNPVAGPAPPARRYAAFAYAPDLKGCVLNGGSDDESGRRGFKDTWLFQGRSWTCMAASFDTAINDDHGLAYHRVAKRLILAGGLHGPQGVLVREADGWQLAPAQPLPPRYQCSPLVWDAGLEGVLFHGGEAHHGGAQFATTWLLQLSADPNGDAGS
jgi:hypothetical protein